MITTDGLVSSVRGDGREVAAAVENHQVTTAPRLGRAAAMASMLNRRTGHARFRRGPVDVQQHPAPSSDQPSSCEGFSASASASSSLPSTTTTALTSVTAGEGSVSDGRARQVQLQPASGHSAGEPRCFERRALSANDDAGDGKPQGGRCHCSKKRKARNKTVIRVPAISSRNADIPPDDHSWRKYGQKPIKGSPYPRGYYKCSTVRGCPARKHVERDPREPAMLIVTYEGDHRHDVRPDHAGSAAAAIAPA